MVVEGKDAFPGEKTEEDKQPEEEKDFVDRLKKKRCEKVKRVKKGWNLKLIYVFPGLL